MKVASEVAADKLRGGFYSPAALVQVCLDRAMSLVRDSPELQVLEPSAGDGAFITGLAEHPLAERVTSVTAIEIVPREAAICQQRLQKAAFGGETLQMSVLEWALTDRREFDLALGNPPFVRFQFVGDAERVNALRLGDELGVTFKGVSNLWLPILLAALGKLRPGGVFSFILPFESFTGISGHDVREWLLERVEELHVDLFPPASFPGVLQEVVVLSARVAGKHGRPSRDIHLREHSSGPTREWTHRSVNGYRTWTRLLLAPDLVTSLEEALYLPSVTPLGEVARFEVATVTGANAFFCVNNQTAEEYSLFDWALPLLPRTRHAQGLAFTETDHKSVVDQGLSGWLLDFSASKPDPLTRKGSGSYLASGEEEGLHTRFKTRIRTPWYRVPVVAPGAMMMAKRSHLFPRVIVNEAAVTTTDTIYRGRLLPCTQTTPEEFTAAFHNSLTLLTAEIEGRSFGGGVLELVPSEVSRLAIPHPEGIGEDFDELDLLCRSVGAEDDQRLIDTTDKIVTRKTPGLTPSLMSKLQEALAVLRDLRLARN